MKTETELQKKDSELKEQLKQLAIDILAKQADIAKQKAIIDDSTDSKIIKVVSAKMADLEAEMTALSNSQIKAKAEVAEIGAELRIYKDRAEAEAVEARQAECLKKCREYDKLIAEANALARAIKIDCDYLSQKSVDYPFLIHTHIPDQLELLRIRPDFQNMGVI